MGVLVGSFYVVGYDVVMMKKVVKVFKWWFYVDYMMLRFGFLKGDCVR